jgi:epoxyqueuosine reductase
LRNKARRDSLTAERVIAIAKECGFELAGIAAAEPAEDCALFETWRSADYAAEMRYLTDRRGDLRTDPRNLMASARSILCVGRLYNTRAPYSTEFFATPGNETRGWVSRYAWGEDYHEVLWTGLEHVVERLRAETGEAFEARISVDTAPLLERTYARLAGLGWIGKNTCLINQQSGSWFFLGEVLLSLDLTPSEAPPDRCGTCTRCIDACPTVALVPSNNGGFTLDAARCISYLTIEKRGDFSTEERAALGGHVFGCDICQDVCPWNRKAPVTQDPRFAAQNYAPELEELATLSEEEFREKFRGSAVKRAKFAGLQRNVKAVRSART